LDRSEMVALIQGGVPEPGGSWAELGAGSGNFTVALAQLLGPGAEITAVDRDARAIDRHRELAQQQPFGVAIHPVEADFTRPLRLPPLDGLLVANALHFVRDQPALLARVATYLHPAGRLLVVEYELRAPRPYVPYPVPFARLAELAPVAGFAAPQLVGTRRSPSTGITLYAAAAPRTN